MHDSTTTIKVEVDTTKTRGILRVGNWRSVTSYAFKIHGNIVDFIDEPIEEDLTETDKAFAENVFTAWVENVMANFKANYLETLTG